MKSPPFCPNPHCPNHRHPSSRRWFWRAGHYDTRTFGSVQRFSCLTCSHRFSTQSFSIDYYAKRKLDYRYVDRQLRSTGSIRDISRDLAATTGSVTNRISRLARNALAAHCRLAAMAVDEEDLVADGFESFCSSQYFPNNITLLVGKYSQYLYFANYCTLRRKGRMTDRQKRVREELESRWKADPKAVRKAFDEVVGRIGTVKGHRRLYTDEKREYVQSLRDAQHCIEIEHVAVSSKLRRTVSNDLFSVNYFDREIRKDCANHVRETVCFARNVNNCMERLWVYFVHHNYRKRYRIRWRERRTHAEVAGIDPRDIRRIMKGYYTRRSFLTKTGVSGSIRDLWLRELETPMRGEVEPLPAYATG